MVFLLPDRETAIQQKPSALRAYNQIVIGIIVFYTYKQLEGSYVIAAKRPRYFPRASSPARGKINYLRELCASSEAGGITIKRSLYIFYGEQRT